MKRGRTQQINDHQTFNNKFSRNVDMFKDRKNILNNFFNGRADLEEVVNMSFDEIVSATEKLNFNEIDIETLMSCVEFEYMPDRCFNNKNTRKSIGILIEMNKKSCTWQTHFIIVYLIYILVCKHMELLHIYPKLQKTVLTRLDYFMNYTFEPCKVFKYIKVTLEEKLSSIE